MIIVNFSPEIGVYVLAACITPNSLVLLLASITGVRRLLASTLELLAVKAVTAQGMKTAPASIVASAIASAELSLVDVNVVGLSITLMSGSVDSLVLDTTAILHISTS